MDFLELANAGGLGILGFNAGFETGKATPEETAEEMRKVIRRTRELKGDMEAGINTVSSAASLIKSIDSCDNIVNELARGYDC